MDNFAPRRFCGLALALVLCLAAVSCLPDEVTWIGFSPSDRYLACGTKAGALRIVDLEARKVAEVAKDVAGGQIQWAPDRDRLAFCLRRDGQWDLALTDPAGSITLLTRDIWRDSQPTWSPDGGGIYFVSSRGGGYGGDYDIRYYDLARNESLPLISGPHDQTDPCISPDGRWLAAVSYQNGNPLILIYAVKTLRAIQIVPPPELRGGPLRLLVWLPDSRRLLYEVKMGDRHHLVECEIESEKTRVVESSDQPFESVRLDRAGHALYYRTGGQVWRRSVGERWGRPRRLSFDGLPVSGLAARHRDDRLGVVVAGSLLAMASASGRDVKPLLGQETELLLWGDLELQLGHKEKGLRHYQTAFAMMRTATQTPSDAETAVAKAKLARAALLCRLGHSRQAMAFLIEAQHGLDDKTDTETQTRLCFLFAFTEFVWNKDDPAARTWLSQIPSTSTAALLAGVLRHPDPRVRQSTRRGAVAFWRGDAEAGLRTFEQLLELRPGDPVVQALYRESLHDAFALPLPDVFELPAREGPGEKQRARMIARYPKIVGPAFQMDAEWFFELALSSLTLRDGEGLKRLLLDHGPQFLKPDDVLDAYRRYWRMEDQDGRQDAETEELLARVLFDKAVVDKVLKDQGDPARQVEVRLACARRALLGGDQDEMKTILAGIAQTIDRAGRNFVFGTNREAAVAYTILQAELAERLGAWEKAVAQYREATTMLEGLVKQAEPGSQKRLAVLLSETRFRAGLLQRAGSAKGELMELLPIERAMGDGLMTQSSDPASLANGIHNYFALLGRVGTPWIKDVIYLKAGQGYRRLGQWGEAAFCLRTAAQSREKFVVQRARDELADLFADREDGGLAAWYSPRR